MASQVLSMPELFCYGPSQAADTYCREMNEWLGSQVGEDFDGFGILPMQDPQLAAARWMRSRPSGERRGDRLERQRRVLAQRRL